MYTVHFTVCTIQTRVQYTRNKPRERTYVNYAFVTNEQAGFNFYLKWVRFHIYYIQELLLGTVLLKKYFATAQVPLFIHFLEKESMSYNALLTEKEPVNNITISKLTNKLQTLATSFDCTSVQIVNLFWAFNSDSN